MKKMMLLVFALLAMVNTADARRHSRGYRDSSCAPVCDPCPPKCPPKPECEKVEEWYESEPCSIPTVVQSPGVTVKKCVTTCTKDPCSGCMTPQAAQAKYGDKLRSSTSGSMY